MKNSNILEEYFKIIGSVVGTFGNTPLQIGMSSGSKRHLVEDAQTLSNLPVEGLLEDNNLNLDINIYFDGRIFPFIDKVSENFQKIPAHERQRFFGDHALRLLLAGGTSLENRNHIMLEKLLKTGKCTNAVNLIRERRNYSGYHHLKIEEFQEIWTINDYYIEMKEETWDVDRLWNEYMSEPAPKPSLPIIKMAFSLEEKPSEEKLVFSLSLSGENLENAKDSFYVEPNQFKADIIKAIEFTLPQGYVGYWQERLDQRAYEKEMPRNIVEIEKKKVYAVISLPRKALHSIHENDTGIHEIEGAQVHLLHVHNPSVKKFINEIQGLALRKSFFSLKELETLKNFDDALQHVEEEWKGANIGHPKLLDLIENKGKKLFEPEVEIEVFCTGAFVVSFEGPDKDLNSFWFNGVHLASHCHDISSDRHDEDIAKNFCQTVAYVEPGLFEEDIETEEQNYSEKMF